MDECKGIDFDCRLGNKIAEWGQSAAETFVKSMAEGAVSVLEWLNTFWLGMPSPDVNASPVTAIQQNLSWYTFVFALIGILIALGRMAVTHEFRSGAGAVRMIANLIVVSAVLATGFTSLMAAGDAFAPWIVEQVTDDPMSLQGILSVDLFLVTGIGPGLILALLAFLASLANVAFMIVRGALVLVLFAFLPTLAAASGSESGAQAFRKAMSWLLAFILFKPVAGGIYALGILMLKDPPQIAGLDPNANAIYVTSLAIVILLAAALALPALIKFIAPVAAGGSSGAFSGAAAAAGVVATGAAVVAIGATGGAAAPAAAGAGTTATTSGTAASTTGTTAAANGAAGGGAAGGGTASGGGSTPSGGGSGSGTGGSSPAGAASDGPGTSSGAGTSSNGASSGSTSGSGASPSETTSTGTNGASGAQPAAAPDNSGATTATTGSSSADRTRVGAQVVGDLANTGATAAGAMDDVTEEKR
ncbi:MULTISPECIES: hypothetical protein [Cellulosimicrobium]|uniref:hypothetical protein n=1 Tax=Cellulosimicrobium TaxID=157920 RepID=UPI001BAC8200|nr:hypothetical protein [Cellulosimicrobium cellulans]QUC01998.1 hypothetical protein J5A69_19640 [Cellulosimicrobium cellulans]